MCAYLVHDLVFVRVLGNVFKLQLEEESNNHTSDKNVINYNMQALSSPGTQYVEWSKKATDWPWLVGLCTDRIFEVFVICSVYREYLIFRFALFLKNMDI